jgi:osmotically-inducible protein OsmY
MKHRSASPALAALAAWLTAASLLGACAPIVVGGAMVGGSMMAIDRRTSGAQVEDQAIEVKATSRISDLATLGNVSVTSYNRMVLLTGEVPSLDERRRVEDAIAKLENVRSVVNELAVAGNSSLTAQSNDALLSAKVKATFVDTADLQANSIKVVTERSVVYLMGRVSEREAARAALVASTVPGVQKVVRVFEILTEQELAGILSQSGGAPAPAASAPPK